MSLFTRLNGVLKTGWTSVFLFFFSVVICLVSWVVLKPDYLVNPGLTYYQRFVGDYVTTVRSLIEGQGFGTFRYPPVFPLILVSLYQIAHTVNISEAVVLGTYSILFTALATVVLYWTARQIWQPIAAFVVACLWATYPPAVFSAGQLGSETPFILFLFLSVFFLLRVLKTPRRLIEYLGLGIATDLAMMTRPVAVFLPLIYIVFLWWVWHREPELRQKLLRLGLIVVGVLSFVLPWEIYVYSQTQQLVLLSTNDVPSIVDGATYAYFLKYGRHVTVPDDVYALQKDIYNAHIETMGQMLSYFASQMTARPRAVILHFAIKAANSWYRTDSNQQDNILLILQIPYVLLFAIAGILSFRRAGQVRLTAIFVWLVLAYFWAMTTVVLSILRYMLPAIGLLFLTVPALGYLWQQRPVSATSDDVVIPNEVPVPDAH